MNKTPHVTAILLAAGRSARMGEQNKLIHPILIKTKDKSTILEQSLENLADSNVDDIILVTGFEADKISSLPLVKKLLAEQTSGQKLKIVINHNYSQGMGTSLAQGVKHLSKNTDACLVTLGDMPFIKPATINDIIETYKNHPEKHIFAPYYQEQMGHPVLWRRKFFKQLEGLGEDKGAKHIIENNKDQILAIKVKDSAILKDIDTIEMLP